MVPGLGVRRLARFASVDYVGAVCSQITTNVLPLLVISVLGPVAAGSFYIAGLITSGAASVGANFSTGLLVEGSATPDRLAEITRGALKRCVMLMAPAAIVMVFGARIILRIYGGSFTAQTVVLFQLLSLTLLPVCVETIAYSLDRIAGKPLRATLSQLAITVLTLGGSWLMFGRLGVKGVGVAVLGADTAVALVRLPTVLAVLRRRPGVIEQPASEAQQAAVPGSRPRPTRIGPPIVGITRAATGQQNWAAPGPRPPVAPSRCIAKWRMPVARHRSRRNRPRAVPAGAPGLPPIRVELVPPSPAAKPAPIISRASARRIAHRDGRRTCAWRQDQQASSGRNRAVALFRTYVPSGTSPGRNGPFGAVRLT